MVKQLSNLLLACEICKVYIFFIDVFRPVGLAETCGLYSFFEYKYCVE